MKIFSILLFLIVLYSCGRNLSESYLANSNSIVVNDSVRPILDSLIKFDVVHDEAIGYDGIESNVYFTFKKLQSKSTNTELISLTDHSNTSVRVYSFWALAKRKYNVRSILGKHLSDSSEFTYVSGCTPEYQKVNQFYLDIVTPQLIDLECIKLSQDEINTFKTQINR